MNIIIRVILFFIDILVVFYVKIMIVFRENSGFPCLPAIWISKNVDIFDVIFLEYSLIK